MKVRVALRTWGPGQSRGKRRRGKGQTKRKIRKSRAPDRAGMNSARPIPAERIRCSWEVKELGEVASGEWPATAGRRVTSWKKKQQQVPRCARNDNSWAFGRAG